MNEETKKATKEPRRAGPESWIKRVRWNGVKEELEDEKIVHK